MMQVSYLLLSLRLDWVPSMDGLKKSTWQERVKQVEIFHTSQLRENPKWRLEDTARELNRSIGRISEDLLLASWMKTHPRVETFEKVQHALDYVRKKRRELRIAGV